MFIPNNALVFSCIPTLEEKLEVNSESPNVCFELANGKYSFLFTDLAIQT